MPNRENPAVSWLQAGYTTERSRLPDGAAGIGRGGRWGKASRHGGSRTAAGATRNPLRIPRIVDRAVVAVFVGRTHRKFVHVRLAKHYHAGRLQPFHDRGIVRRNEVVQHPGPAGGAYTARAENILVRQRHAGQRAGFAGGPSAIRRFGLRQSLRPRYGDEAVE